MAVPDYLSKPAHCHPNHHLNLIASAVPQKNSSDQPTLTLRSDGFPPPLEMPFSHWWVSNWVSAFLIFHCFDTYGLCGGGVWHYSSFKYRILDCVTRPNFIMPYSERAGHKSWDRTPVIYHITETKQEWDDQVLNKVGKTEVFQYWKMGCFVKQRDKGIGSIASRYSQLGVLWCNLTTNCEINFQAHKALSHYYRYPLLKVSNVSTVLLWICFTQSAHIHHSISSELSCEML